MSKPLRVMQVVGRMMGGGVEATVMNHYRHIDHSRIQFDFVVQSDSIAVPVEEIKNLGGRIITVPSYTNPLAYMHACRSVFTQYKPLIVHSHMNAISAFTLRAAKQAKIPIRIAHSHSTANPNEKAKTAVKNLLRPFSRIYPNYLAACGTYSARWLFGDKIVETGKVKIIRNAIELDQFRYDPSARKRLRAEIGAKSDTLVVGQVGRFCEQKNQSFSMNIWTELLKEQPNSLLVMLGIGDDLDKIKEQARKSGIDQTIRFMGIRRDVNKWYSAFDVLLFPSLYEGLPLTAVEAQAAALPIVASDQITKEAFLIPNLCNIHKLSIGSVSWARTLVDVAKKDFVTQRSEINTLKPLTSAGYDISQSARNLANWYEQLTAGIITKTTARTSNVSKVDSK